MDQEQQTMNEATIWRAVETKDARFDGSFFYGVRSTGIYCKPSCPSRRPRRERVSFFTSCGAAEAAGFRSCLRCLPRNAEARDPQVEMIERACRAIETHAVGAPSLATLGAELNVSPYHLQRTFKKIVGVTPRQYAAARRVNGFKARVKEGEAVIDAMYDAGFNSSSRLYERSDAELGMSPAVYRRGGTGMEITYTVVGCSLGRLLVAATERGLCAVTLGDSDEELVERLFADFPAADVTANAGALHLWVEAILRHLDGKCATLDLPLDVRATAFQRRVWEELRRVPYGSTRSYGEIARAIGQLTAVRAVARACATNPVALVTPCHRIVREDGGLSGYRWGIERKRELLERERQHAVHTNDKQ
ncbi:MAG: bifunctional DNA-binding transcriptional regulator/O6-methylguanine-DNA methyltransferase Ada [Acidobacteriota bacterium]|nr:bifunctional DNA-binding transcriptional regulator/O6-methylguanine-DNA methyltransferase Ada [Acidobacteriota bacterium]